MDVSVRFQIFRMRVYLSIRAIVIYSLCFESYNQSTESPNVVAGHITLKTALQCPAPTICPVVARRG